MKEQIKAPEKIQWRDEEIANLSGAEFQTLVIKMLTELVEYGCKIEEKVRAIKSEIKENVQGTNSDGKETGTHINRWLGLKGRNKYSTRTEWRNKNSKNEERLRKFWDSFKCSNIWIIGVPEGEEEEQEVETYLKT